MTITDRNPSLFRRLLCCITGKSPTLLCDTEIGPLSTNGHKVYRLHGARYHVQLTAREADYLQSLRRQAVTK